MTTVVDRQGGDDKPAPSKRRDRTHWLYLAVIFAVVAGVAVGLAAPRRSARRSEFSGRCSSA